MNYDFQIIKLNELYKKYPFIYKVHDDYFFIGTGICKPCYSKVALDYFNRYTSILNDVDDKMIIEYSDWLSRIDGNIKDALLYCFRKIKAYSESNVDTKDLLIFKKRIEDFTLHLSESEKTDLHKQLVISIEAFRCYRNYS